MAPVTRSKKKTGEKSSIDQSQSARGVKRSAEEEETDKIEEKKGKQARKGMNKGQMDDSEKKLPKSQQESKGNTESEGSLMDLSDESLRKIFGFLDLPSRLNLRLNKRLERLHFEVKVNIKKITYQTIRHVSRFKLDDHHYVDSSMGTEGWEQGLLRLAKNTSVESISIRSFTGPTEEHCDVTKALFNFNADQLIFSGNNRALHVPYLTLPSFLILAKNVKQASFDVTCTSLSSADLGVIRKTMLDGCVMKTFVISVDELEKAFMKECFGVIIEDVSQPVPGRIYRTRDESLELYKIHGRIHHYEGNLHTIFCDTDVQFSRLDVVKKPDNDFKLKLNEVVPN